MTIALDYSYNLPIIIGFLALLVLFIAGPIISIFVFKQDWKRHMLFGGGGVVTLALVAGALAFLHPIPPQYQATFDGKDINSYDSVMTNVFDLIPSKTADGYYTSTYNDSTYTECRLDFNAPQSLTAGRYGADADMTCLNVDTGEREHMRGDKPAFYEE